MHNKSIISEIRQTQDLRGIEIITAGNYVTGDFLNLCCKIMGGNKTILKVTFHETNSSGL